MMPTTRSYSDICPIARALDVVGERWALLVVRELLLGPQRFSDLRRALPGASSNMLTDRLRELELRGVLRRRTLPTPVWTISNPHRRMEIEPGDPATPEAGIQTDPATLAALLLNPDGLDAAIAGGSVRTNGKITALRRLLRVAA